MKSDQTYGQVSLSIEGIGSRNTTSESNSNIFTKSNSFGKYKYTSKFKEESKRLKKIEKRINELNETLIIAGKSLKDVYPVQRHDYYIEFNGHLLSSKNPFYKDVSEIFQDILKAKKKKIFEVTLVDSSLSILKANKVKKTIYDKEENCVGSATSGVCKIKGLGFISL